VSKLEFDIKKNIKYIGGENMKEIFLRKELVIGIIFLFLGASISPVLGASLTIPKETTEGNNLIEIVDESSEMMTVTKIKLLDNGFIRNVNEKMSLKDYNEYVEKISACGCGDVEGAFTVLKEYGIVPESMAVDQFVQIIDKKMDKFSFITNLFKQIKVHPRPADTVECSLTVAIWTLNPISYNVNIPLIYFSGSADLGGKITSACGESHEWDDEMSVTMILYLGILVYTPYVCLFACTFAGWTTLFHAWGW
jgi:hypothetical protein